jgi:hypothetical protein
MYGRKRALNRCGDWPPPAASLALQYVEYIESLADDTESILNLSESLRKENLCATSFFAFVYHILRPGAPRCSKVCPPNEYITKKLRLRRFSAEIAKEANELATGTGSKEYANMVDTARSSISRGCVLIILELERFSSSISA